MNILSKHKWRSLIPIGLLCLLSSAVWAQQSYVIKGKIVDAISGDPLIGAIATIESLDIGTTTDYNGDYELMVSAEPGDYMLSFIFLGYGTDVQPITLGASSMLEVNSNLSIDQLSLDEVVVTGSATAVSKRELGNAISTLSSADISNSGSLAADQALSGKVAGALVMQNSGDPAGGISIRLRGPSTISGSSDPLYIVDGVIVNNSSNNLIDLGGNTQNRLVDINPADIDRIEVIKGAAAAAIYGARASNGVVQIFTKRGANGAPRISFNTGLKFSELRKQIAYNDEPLKWANPFDNSDLTTEPTTRYNYQDDFFQKGMGSEHNLSVTGGSDKTKYFASGGYTNNPGIITNTNFKRFNARLNLDQIVNDWLSFKVGLNYSNSASNDIPNGGINSAYGAITGYVFSENSVNPAPDASGVYPVTSLLVARTNPLEAVNRFDFNQETNRVLTNLGISIVPVEELTINYNFGMDSYNQSGKAYIPVGNTSPNPTGLARRADANVFQFNSDLNAAYVTQLTDDIKSTTAVGGTWQQNRRESIALVSDRLAPTVQTADGGTITGQGDSRSEASYWGGYVQQTLGFNNSLFVTGALRMDGASVFGADQRNQLYGKASASYVLSNADFWKEGIGKTISSAKLRASWGQAGNLTALGAFDRFSLYNALAINGTSGVTPSTLLGNSDLKPERQEEIELGIDLGFMNDRIGLEFTYYHQDVTDLLLRRELAASSGYSTRFENVGSLTNDGIELLLRATPIQSKDLNWNVSVTYGANNNVVKEVVGDRITLPGSFATSYVIPGESLGVFYRQFYARDANGDIIYNEDGYPSKGTTEDGNNRKILGDPNPDWFGSFISDLSYKGFGFRMQFDAVQGFDVFNWNRRLMDNVIFGGGAKVAAELRGDLPKGLGRAEAGIFEEFVEDGSFVKLRELSLSYGFKPQIEGIGNMRVSFAGRNLISWDNYTGWDPEINTTGQSNGVRGFDFAGVPIPRTYSINLAVDF